VQLFAVSKVRLELLALAVRLELPGLCHLFEDIQGLVRMSNLVLLCLEVVALEGKRKLKGEN
jgi:hypothetical protein